MVTADSFDAVKKMCPKKLMILICFDIGKKIGINDIRMNSLEG